MPTGAIALNFGMRGDIADVSTHSKFCDCRFRGFGVLISPISPFCIGLAGCRYNSVSTAVLHCDDAVKLLYLQQIYKINACSSHYYRKINSSSSLSLLATLVVQTEHSIWCVCPDSNF